MDRLWQNVKDATRSVTVVRTLKNLIALIVIVLITGAYGMSKALQTNKIELTKTRLINQMADNKNTTQEIEILKARIKKNEGYELLPYNLEYDDAHGNTIKEDFFTGGFGHVIQKGESKPENGYTDEYWESVFEKDFEKAHNGALKLVGTDLDYRAIGVVTEMIYQMGYDGVSKFKKTLEYMENGQWEFASKEMLDSKWAIQTPDRADELSKLIKNIK